MNIALPSAGAMTRLLVVPVCAFLMLTACDVRAAIAFQTKTNGENGSGSNTLTINVPSGVVAGDFLLAQITVEKGSDVIITAPTNWVLVRRTNRSSDIGQAIYYKIATASEPTSYTWNFTNGPKAAGGILRYTGVDTSNPIIASSGNTGESSSLTGTSIVSESNSMLVAFFGLKKKDATLSTPTGMTERYLFQNDNDVRIKSADEINPANPTGNRVSTANTTEKWVAQLVTLRAAAGAGTPGSFNAFETSTAANAITGVIKTRIAGSAFSLDVVAIESGAQMSSFTDTVTVELLGNNTLGVSLDANNCPTSFTTVQTVSPNPTITNGRSTVSFAAVANSWRDVRVRVRYPASSPTVTSCSTDNFAIRPNAFASFSVSDSDWQTAGTGRSLSDVTFGSVTHKAGRPFSVRANAVNAAGSPAVTTNYALTPAATLTACAGAACTASFGTLTLGSAFAAGQLVADAASYDNVGSFRVELVDSSFASVDAGDSSALEREIRSGTIDVGRFVPDHFAVAFNTPVFGTDCGSFTYVGRAFSYTTPPVITVTGQDFSNNPTALYTGAWFRISNSSLTGKAYAAATGGTPDTSGVPVTDPVIAASGGGVGTLTFSSGTGLLFTRTTPVAPFDAEISLEINVIDDDGVTFAGNPARFGTATAGNGIAFNNGKAMRFGRLRLNNALGSSLLDLPLPLSTQYYDGNFFVANTLDSCTTLSASDIAFSFLAATPNLVACETHLNPAGTISFTSGNAAVRLTKPGNTNNGAVDLTVNLGAVASGNTCTSATTSAATAANKIWLQGDWGSGSYNENPRGRATFGIFKNADQFLYFREVY